MAKRTGYPGAALTFASGRESARVSSLSVTRMDARHLSANERLPRGDRTGSGDEPVDAGAHEFERLGLLGRSSRFIAALERIRRLAACDATVLIQGETGTGKELAARAIHYLGARRHGPFIPVNCGAIPETLVESELFGHSRGAFTDAREARCGVVTQAERGTLFLDEIESLSARGQVALLRFLQDHQYRPVGGDKVRGADVRVIAASNVDLRDLVRDGRFREDLLYRLDVLGVAMPPLRERGDDVVVLARAFAERFAVEHRARPWQADAATIAALRANRWPGNVRELENAVLRMTLLAEPAEPIEFAERRPSDMAQGSSDPADMDDPTAPRPARACGHAASGIEPFHQAKARAIAAFERHYLVDLLDRTGWNVSQAARASGKERSRLGKLIRKHGLIRSTAK